MNYVSIAALVVAGFVLGAAPDVLGSRPLWSYHNGYTLLPKTVDYRNGYVVGVLDGYLRAHDRMARHEETPHWLDECLAKGRTVKEVESFLADHLAASVKQNRRPAAATILDGLKVDCRAK